jgi:serine/threonine protein kinase
MPSRSSGCSVGVLGQGATGIVYDAHRLIEGDRVALKVIHQHLAGDAHIRGRFAREAAILRRLEGKHICPILDYGEVPDPRRESTGLVYMALLRIDGPALDAVIARESTIPIERAAAIVLDVCAALSEAHAQGVIHRDLKPPNVLLRGDDRAVVVDFGMAKIVAGGSGGTTALTQHNMVFGTPEYMAPEQARGDELDARCDVYAAGIILYELLTGRVPFRGGSVLNVLTAQMTATPQPPRERAPERGISPALQAVVLHALEKDPVDRYATAASLAAALRSALAAPDDVEAVRPAAQIPDADLLEARVAPAPVAPVVRGTAGPTRAWVIVCVVAGIVGIALGAWLSMDR